MKRLTIILLAAVSLVAASCATYTASSALKEPVDDLVLLEPISIIQYFTQEDMVIVDNDMSVESSEMVQESILARPGYFHVTDDAILTPQAQEDLVNFTNYVRGLSKKAIPAMPIPKSIREIIESTGHRYAMAVVSGGFTRNKKNYRRAVVRGLAISILSLGSVVTVPYKNVFNSTVVIFDTKTDQVIYYNPVDPRTMDPMDRSRVDNYLTALVSRYKWVF
ncbi:MAG: hypothetical protein J5490_08885 [Bacteroidales bacterium]|jgi:hypothetical protein|nr:hypothetical protein [Bacteroidales bacterium]